MSSSAAEAPGDPQAAGARLRELLTQPSRYRRQWMQKAQRMRHGSINESAVARVIAEYLWVTAQVADTEADTPRRLKDIVYRALNGKHLTSRTLSWFIDAFNIDEADTAELWSLLTGTDQSSTVRGDLRPPPSAAAAFQPPKYQTLTLLDFHEIGRDGIPSRHRTVQVIRAIQDGLNRYPFRFDTTTATVEVITGGRATPIYRVDENMHAVDIVLPSPLRRNETATLEYVTSFKYDSQPPAEFRRAATRRIENLSMHVRFHPQMRPRNIWWAIWSDFREESPQLMHEKVELDPDLGVNRHIDAIERTVVGFHWEW